ncbi:MAG: hypothetical protein CME63_10630 [Halobacteriovoraceae bacterium]|nr:hypothetical protein [Halobacteriovoraceae bacterium]
MNYIRTNPFKLLLSLCLVYLVYLSFLVMGENRHNFEGGLYEKRFESIKKDKDFNLINNIDSEYSPILTPTDNIADMHDLGAPIIWSYFYDWYQTFLPYVKDIKISDHSYLSLEDILVSSLHYLCFLGMIYLLYASQLINKSFIPYTFLLAISLAIYDYLIDHFYSADILALFFMGLSLIHLIKEDLAESKSSYVLGILIGVLRVIKISSIIYLPAILFIYIFFAIRSYRNNDLSLAKDITRGFFRFSAVYLFFILITEINFYSTLGRFSFFQGYDYAYSLNHILNTHAWKATYFAPRGLLLHCPILFLTLIPIISLFRKLSQPYKKEEIILLIFSVFYLIKLSLGLFSITAHYLGIGARQFFIDFVLICLLYNHSFKENRKTAIMAILYSSLMSCLYYITWLSLDKDFELFATSSAHSLSDWKLQLKVLLVQIPHTLKLVGILVYHRVDILFPFLFVFLIGLGLIASYRKYKLQTAFSFAIIIFVYSLFNLNFNAPNSDNYISKKGYSSYIISKGGSLFLAEELISGMTLATQYEKRHGNQKSYEHIKRIKEDIFKSLKEDIAFSGRDVEVDALKSSFMDNPKLPSIELNLNQKR